LRDNLWIGHAGFILTGIANTLLGPILPILSLRWTMSDAQAGRLFAAEFVGAMVGTILSSRFMPSLGCRRTAALGLFLTAVGVAALCASDPKAGLASIFCLGLGLGISIPATNLWITLAEPERSAAAANLLNASWCLGAAASAPLVLMLARHFSFGATLLAVAIPVALIAAVSAIEREKIRPREVNAVMMQSDSSRHAGSRRAFIVLITILIFFYVGSETGIGGWVTTYATRLNLLSASTIGLAQSTFYGALLIGRLIAPLVLRKTRAPRLILFGLGIAAAGMVLSVAASRALPVLVGLFIVGVGFAPVFPTTVATFSDRLGSDSIRVAGSVFTFGYVGAATIPFAMGQVSERFHALRYGMLLALGCIFVLLAVQTRIIGQLHHRGSSNS